MLPRLKAIILLVATLFLTPGCQGQGDFFTGGKPPEIAGNDIHGEYVSLHGLKGKVVVIYFWRNSCCGNTLKRVEEIYRRHQQDGLSVLAINEGDGEASVRAIAEKGGLTFTIQTDEHAMTARQYRVIGYPTIIIVGRQGTVSRKILGESDPAVLERMLVDLLRT